MPKPFRVITTYHTSHDIEKLPDDMNLDLYMLLREIWLCVPPLRHRKSELAHLIHPLLLAHELPAKTIRPDAWYAICQLDFSGNLNELISLLKHVSCMAMEQDEISIDDLPVYCRGTKHNASKYPPASLQHAMRDYEKLYIRSKLSKTGGKKQEAAKLLGISRKKLWEKMK